MKPLPEFLETLIASPPAAGSGVHDWMFSVARNLHAHLPAGEIENLIRSRVAKCGRVVPDREIKDAVKRSIDFAWQPKGAVGEAATANPVPEPDLAKIERLCAAGPGVADLWEASPIRFEEPRCEYIMDQLFPGNPLLCCGPDAGTFDTRTREEWRGILDRQAYLVPSPMTARQGPIADGTGKMSAHAKSIVGPRRYLVIEFDFSKFGRDKQKPTQFHDLLCRLEKLEVSVHDMCSTLLLLLDSLHPMTLAVSSGGKSIHGWWFADGQPESSLKSFHNLAVTYGADPRTWWPSQFVRMPDGTRQNGNPQPVYFFNPDTLPKP
jgi:hypothetical protein